MTSIELANAIIDFIRGFDPFTYYNIITNDEREDAVRQLAIDPGRALEWLEYIIYEYEDEDDIATARKLIADVNATIVKIDAIKRSAIKRHFYLAWHKKNDLASEVTSIYRFAKKSERNACINGMNGDCWAIRSHGEAISRDEAKRIFPQAFDGTHEWGVCESDGSEFFDLRILND